MWLHASSARSSHVMMTEDSAISPSSRRTPRNTTCERPWGGPAPPGGTEPRPRGTKQRSGCGPHAGESERGGTGTRAVRGGLAGGAALPGDGSRSESPSRSDDEEAPVRGGSAVRGASADRRGDDGPSRAGAGSEDTSRVISFGTPNLRRSRHTCAAAARLSDSGGSRHSQRQLPGVVGGGGAPGQTGRAMPWPCRWWCGPCPAGS